MTTDSEEPPSMEALARRYLDIWQAQWAALAGDPAMADNIARTMAAMNQSALMLNPFLAGLSGGAPPSAWQGLMAGLWPGAGATAAGGGANKAGRDGRPEHDGAMAPGAPPAGAASGDGAGDPDVLAGRIASLERELAALASEPAPAGDKAARRTGGTRRRKSGP